MLTYILLLSLKHGSTANSIWDYSNEHSTSICTAHKQIDKKLPIDAIGITRHNRYVYIDTL